MIQENRDDQQAICKIPNVLVHCTLPQRDPGPVDKWSRSQNGVEIIIHPYIWSSGENSSKHMKNPPQRRYPYGSPSRCLLFTVGWEAAAKESPKLFMKSIFDTFCTRFNIRTTHGHQRERIMDHMMRLFRCSIEFRKDTKNERKWRTFPIAEEGYLAWDDTNFKGRLTRDSYIVLSKGFYESVTLNPVPVDMRAIQALRHSAMCLDLYSWSTYTNFLISCVPSGAKPQPRIFTWSDLTEQFGSDYEHPSEFKENLPRALRQVHQVYPELTVELLREGLKVYPARPSVVPQEKEEQPIGA